MIMYEMYTFTFSSLPFVNLYSRSNRPRMSHTMHIYSTRSRMIHCMNQHPAFYYSDSNIFHTRFNSIGLQPVFISIQFNSMEPQPVLPWQADTLSTNHISQYTKVFHMILSLPSSSFHFLLTCQYMKMHYIRKTLMKFK